MAGNSLQAPALPSLWEISSLSRLLTSKTAPRLLTCHCPLRGLRKPVGRREEIDHQCMTATLNSFHPLGLPPGLLSVVVLPKPSYSRPRLAKSGTLLSLILSTSKWGRSGSEKSRSSAPPWPGRDFSTAFVNYAELQKTREVKEEREAYRPALLQSILGPRSGSSGSSGFIKSEECNLRRIALWFFGASPKAAPSLDWRKEP